MKESGQHLSSATNQPTEPSGQNAPAWPLPAYADYFPNGSIEPARHRDYGKGALIEFGTPPSILSLFPTAGVIELLTHTGDLIECRNVTTAPTLQPEGLVITEANRFFAVDQAGSVTYQLAEAVTPTNTIEHHNGTAGPSPTTQPNGQLLPEPPPQPAQPDSPPVVPASPQRTEPSSATNQPKQKLTSVTGEITGAIIPDKTITNKKKGKTEQVGQFLLNQTEPPPPAGVETVLLHVTVYPGNGGGSLKKFQHQVRSGEIHTGSHVQLDGYDKGAWKATTSSPLHQERAFNAVRTNPL